MSDSTGEEQLGNKKSADKRMEEPITSYQQGESVYKIGDNVYIESQRSDIPYFICAIREFKRSKKDNIAVDVVWYYRPCEIPTSVYQLLLQDRNAENGSSDHVLENPVVKERELFISDAIDVFPASALRGHANCCSFSEVKENILEYISKENNWFYILRYNPESRRMANAKGEIRIGASHQAILPSYIPLSKRTKKELEDLDNLCKEELLWEPSIPESRFTVFSRAARSITSYNGYCNSGEGSADKAVNVLSDDANIAYSFDTLHRSNYNISEALQYLIKNPSPTVTMVPWTDDERKKFMKGLRSYGKVFHKIRKELLPERQTSELVQYYYIWKKTTFAINSRPHKRGGRRNNQLVRKTRTTKPKAATVSEFLDLTSCSESEVVDCEGSDDNRDFSLYACRHCYATKSPNWHHAGKDKLLLCYTCRMYFKRYGRMKPLKDDEIREPPPFIYKAAFENLEDTSVYSGRMRTRRSSTPISSSVNSIKNRILQEARLSTRKQMTTPTATQSDDILEKPAPIKRKTSQEREESEEAKKSRIAMEEEQAEDADDESEGDSDSGNACNGQVTGESSRSQTPNEKNDSTGANNDATEAQSTTFVPIKVEEKEEEPETTENNEITPPSSPDIPDDPAICSKIAVRFKHQETQAGNSCSRCERVYIYEGPREKKPVEIENQKRREEPVKRPRLVETSKFDGNSQHQPAQITSHYLAQRLFTEHAARDQQRFWYHGPPDMHGHRSVSPPPREFVVDPASKFAQILKEDQAMRDHVAPRTPSIQPHQGLSGHAFATRVTSEHSRDFRIPHADHSRVSPPHPHANIDGHTRYPHGVNSLGSGIVPPIERPTVDPITGVPTFQPHLHSHLHTHTHLHVHPDDIKYRGHLPETLSERERLERATPHHMIPPQQHPPHRSSSANRDIHDLNLLMHHEPHLRESIARSVPPSVRESPLPANNRDGAGSPSFPHEIPNMHSDPVAYHLMVTQFARMHQRMNSHSNSGQGHVQAPDLSPHGLPGPPHPHHPHLRGDHDKHIHEQLLLAQAEREKLVRADHLRSMEHEKQMRRMIPSREHLESAAKLKGEHPLLDRASYKQPADIHSPYPGTHYLENLRRSSHETRSIGERGFHDRLAQERLERERIAHFERVVHSERFDRSRHDRPSIIGHYKHETIDLCED